jgi:hypothetical protein
MVAAAALVEDFPVEVVAVGGEYSCKFVGVISLIVSYNSTFKVPI